MRKEPGLSQADAAILTVAMVDGDRVCSIGLSGVGDARQALDLGAIRS